MANANESPYGVTKPRKTPLEKAIEANTKALTNLGSLLLKSPSSSSYSDFDDDKPTKKSNVKHEKKVITQLSDAFKNLEDLIEDQNKNSRNFANDKKQWKAFAEIQRDISQEAFKDLYERLSERQKEIFKDPKLFGSSRGQKELMVIAEESKRLNKLASTKGIRLNEKDTDSLGKKLASGFSNKLSNIPKNMFAKLLKPLTFFTGVEGRDIVDDFLEKRKEKKDLRKYADLNNPIKRGASSLFKKKVPSSGSHPTPQKVLKNDDAAMGTVLLHNDLQEIIKGGGLGGGQQGKGGGGLGNIAETAAGMLGADAIQGLLTKILPAILAAAPIVAAVGGLVALVGIPAAMMNADIQKRIDQELGLYKISRDDFEAARKSGKYGEASNALDYAAGNIDKDRKIIAALAYANSPEGRADKTNIDLANKEQSGQATPVDRYLAAIKNKSLTARTGNLTGLTPSTAVTATMTPAQQKLKDLNSQITTQGIDKKNWTTQTAAEAALVKQRDDLQKLIGTAPPTPAVTIPTSKWFQASINNKSQLFSVQTSDFTKRGQKVDYESMSSSNQVSPSDSDLSNYISYVLKNSTAISPEDKKRLTDAKDKSKEFMNILSDGNIHYFHQGGKAYKEQLAMLRSGETVIDPLETQQYQKYLVDKELSVSKDNQANQTTNNDMYPELLIAIKALQDKIEKVQMTQVNSQTFINKYSPASIMNSFSVI